MPSPFARCNDTRGCRAAASDDAVALARVVPPSHDDGLERSRRLAAKFCDAVLRLASWSELDPHRIVHLARELLSPPEWSNWHVSLAVLQRFGTSWQALNCGSCGILLASPDQPAKPVCSPQTVARKLREDATIAIPGYAFSIAATLLGKDSQPADVEAAIVNLPPRALLLALADPRLFDCLRTESPCALQSPADLIFALDRAATSLHDPDTTCAGVWGPAG